MPKRGGRRKKTRTHKPVELSEFEKKRIPRCFVLKRGKVGDRIGDLVKDFRQVMMPNCAKSLRESKMNRIEDFVAVASHFGVSHLVIFTASKVATYFKIARLPHGPTLTFKVESFSLGRDVRAAQKRPRCGPRDFTVAPLQVLNGFNASKSDQSKLTAEVFRGLFPPIDVQNFNQAECRRTVLFNYDAEKETVSFRHFSVATRQTGLERGVSRLLKASRIPKLGRREDVADFVLGGGAGASDSEAEEMMEAPAAGGGRVGVRLTEIGPRLELLLIKAEEGLCGGSMLYHRYLWKTPSEKEVLKQKADEKRKLKERNEKLEQRERQKKAKQRLKVREKAGKVRSAEDDAKDDESNDGGKGVDEDGFVRGEPAAPRKRRFHPFAFGAKAAQRAGKSKAKTVLIDDKPAKKLRRGGATRTKGGADSASKRTPVRRDASDKSSGSQKRRRT
mmetsp:Transcript_15360/g.33756  ORF Transcript_15360/g.33756 Transcript_15360/m.33756 type:complete len:447 (-) Transcript_15360:36-1376(-)